VSLLRKASSDAPLRGQWLGLRSSRDSRLAAMVAADPDVTGAPARLLTGAVPALVARTAGVLVDADGALNTA